MILGRYNAYGVTDAGGGLPPPTYQYAPTSYKITEQVSPPIIERVEPTEKSASWWSTVVDGITGVVSAFAPKPPPAPVYVPPPEPAIPTWVWVAVPVAIGALVLVSMKGGRKTSMAGYRRRKRRK